MVLVFLWYLSEVTDVHKHTQYLSKMQVLLQNEYSTTSIP